MSAAQVVDCFESTTGDSASEVLASYLFDAFNRTDQRLPKIEYVRLKTSHAPGVWAERADDITDADAVRRTLQGSFVVMAGQLSHLSNAARAMFPGMRSLTKPESENLRSYYKKVFRKA